MATRLEPAGDALANLARTLDKYPRMTTNITIGNVVTGNFHGQEIIGRVTGWIPAKGGLWVVTLDGPIVVCRTERTEVTFSSREALGLTVIDSMTVKAEQSKYTGAFWMPESVAA